MGKIGDLWVRLGLKSEDYKKGMENAKKETTTFSQKLGNMKNVALGVWAAVGAAVVTFAKDFISATNRINDAWSNTMTALKSSYHTFLADLADQGNWDTIKKNFNGLSAIFNIGKTFKMAKGMFGNAKEAGDAAAEMSKAFDAEFELVNSIKLQKQMIQGELNELYIMMRDTTLSPEDRLAAAEKYKGLLQPLADAEIDVYGNMVKYAVKAWQAGNKLDREYSTEELTEFFANIGTKYEEMQAKFPQLMRVYEERKGDAQNQIIFDTLGKLAQATHQMSEIDRQLQRVTQSAKNSLGQPVVRQDLSMPSMTALSGSAAALSTPQIFTDQWMQDQMARGQEFGEWYMGWVYTMQNATQAFENAIISSVTNGFQAITDMMFGLEDVDMGAILQAFLQPFADTLKQMGQMIMAEGIAMEAFKKSFANPFAAIAAGAALIAIGSMVSSGLQSLVSNPTGGSGSSASYGGNSYNSSNVQNYESTLTVEVVGKISGSDILIAGQNQQNKWNR